MAEKRIAIHFEVDAKELTQLNSAISMMNKLEKSFSDMQGQMKKFQTSTGSITEPMQRAEKVQTSMLETMNKMTGTLNDNQKFLKNYIL